MNEWRPAGYVEGCGERRRGNEFGVGDKEIVVVQCSPLYRFEWTVGVDSTFLEMSFLKYIR